MDVVIVESPAKAKTIAKYLGGGAKVLASYGHVRDLPAKDGSVKPEEGFAMEWDTDPKSQKRLNDIAEAVKKADRLVLATDPDREGEAISWHVLEVLAKKRGLLEGKTVERVAFNAITKSAVKEAMAHPRKLDMELVEAYLARRALDYLVGFNLSPVLWRKLPGARSAGRVQSVALRLVVEREREIEAFTTQEYWTVEAEALGAAKKPFKASLEILDGKKLKKFDLANEIDAGRAAAAIEAATFTVASVEASPRNQNPPPPFTTSTLQQEASRKLGFSASHTMRVAQKLYEGVDIGGETTGLITYMRTDGVQMAGEAMHRIREVIQKDHGADYVPEKPRFYKTKAKNAQEAHEAIRPTDAARRPGSVRLAPDEARLYELIWKRAVASQMEAARLERTTVDMVSQDRRTGLRATGQVILFPGYFAIYQEGRDEKSDEDDERVLPPIKQGEAIAVSNVTPSQHFTQPPPRYSEASLVKEMEAKGIGRPSTYASILSVLQDRDYVTLDKKRFIPTGKGRLVTSFLEQFFHKYVEYDFTAGLEQQLDKVSAGELPYKTLLSDFWRDFIAECERATGQSNTEVLDALNEALGPYIFPPREDGADPRTCPVCGEGRLSLKSSFKNGPFIGCSRYPECRYTRPYGEGGADGEDSFIPPEGRVLGDDPDTGLEVTLKTGRFGPYVQLGPDEQDDKPKRSSLPKGWKPEDMDLERALKLLSLPREIGAHPDDGEPITAAIGRFGPFVKHGSTFANVKDADELFEIGMNRAVALLAEKRAGGGGRFGRGAQSSATVLKDVGEHPEGGKIQVLDGRYGPYVKWGKVNATLPKGQAPEDVNVDQALEIIAAKASKKGGKAKGAAASKASAKGASAKGASAKGAAKTGAKTKAKGGRKKAAADKD